MYNSETIVINMMGGPGSGKSTTASGIFYELKKLGYDCELVTEYAKDKVWDGSYETLKDQIYVFGHQYHRLWKLKGKVRFIITDTSLIFGIHYSQYDSKRFNDFVIEAFSHFINLNYFIKRGNTFNDKGRIHDLKESIKADEIIKQIMKDYNIEYKEVEQDDAVKIIVDEIVNKFPLDEKTK